MATFKRKPEKASGQPKKKSATRRKVKSDPQFERTRENNSEFKRAGNALRLTRSAFRELLRYASDNELSNRLTKLFMKVLDSDAINDRGKRTIGSGELDRMRYFNFNHPHSFISTLFTRNTYAYDPAPGVVTVSIPTFRPSSLVECPVGTTHFVITAVAIQVDFDKNVYEHAMQSTEEIALRMEPVQIPDLVLRLAPGSPRPVVLVLCIRFFEMEDGRYYVRKEVNVNAATIVEVFRP